MDFKILYEDNDILAVDKPAGVVVFDEGKNDGEPRRTMIDLLLEKYPELKSVGEVPRYGIVHRLDKDTSGVLLVAKTAEALIFLQKQFKNREVEKKYIALATGALKEDSGTIETLIGRSPMDGRKQKAYSKDENAPASAREAMTDYKVIQRFENPSTPLRASYTLVEVNMKTGRKHQIRCHLAYIHHPIAGDTLYGFKDSPRPEGLERQFLHASYVKIALPIRLAQVGPGGIIKEFNSDLPEELHNILKKLR